MATKKKAKKSTSKTARDKKAAKATRKPAARTKRASTAKKPAAKKKPAARKKPAAAKKPVGPPSEYDDDFSGLPEVSLPDAKPIQLLEDEPPPAGLTDEHAPVDDFTSSGDELVDIFQRYDQDRTGYIERVEFARLLEALGQEVTEDELKIALDAVDANHTGKISFIEFKSWWLSR